MDWLNVLLGRIQKVCLAETEIKRQVPSRPPGGCGKASGSAVKR
jgi:hypothetical protein